MAKFINPFTDIGFKRIFGQEINKDLLLDFLNSLLEGERKVKNITLLDKEQLPEYENDRGLTYDIYCTDENGEQFIVEMQNQGHLNFKDRTVYYLSQAIARQGKKGKIWKYQLKAVYGVNNTSSGRTSCWQTETHTNHTATNCVLSLLNYPLSTKKKTNARMILNVGFMY